MAITETWLYQDVTAAEMSFPGFASFRYDRRNGRKGGGVLLYVKEDLIPEELIREEYHASNSFDIVGCRIPLQNNSLNIMALYRSPTTSEEDNELLLKNIESIAERNEDCIVLGDFNAPSVNWNAMSCPSQNTFDAKLLNVIEDSFLFQCVTENTRFRTSQIPSLLDLIFVKYPDLVSDVKILPPLGRSDHAVVTCVMEAPRNPETPSIPQFCYSAINTETLHALAAETDWEGLKLGDNVEDRWLKLKGTLLDLTDSSVPKRRRRKMARVPWISRPIKRAIHKKHAAWWHYKNSPGDETFAAFKRQRNRVGRLLKKARRKYESRLASDAARKPKRFFAHVRRNKKIADNLTALKDQDGVRIVEPKLQCELMASFYKTIYREDNDREVPTFQRQLPLMNEIVICSAEVEKELRRLDIHKGAGPDGIHPRILKELAPRLAPVLADLFNLTIAQGQVPRDWKKAIVCPIFKKGDKEQAGNYRPVSLTSIPCKILERQIKAALLSHLTVNQAICPQQHGFLPAKSCLSNLLVLEDKVTKLLDEGNYVDLIYLDFAKDFDPVNHRLLCAKLE